MARPKMSAKKKSIDNFVEGAKSTNEEEKVKTFLLRLPYDVWKRAKSCALEQDMTLHDYLVEVIKKHLLTSYKDQDFF